MNKVATLSLLGSTRALGLLDLEEYSHLKQILTQVWFGGHETVQLSQADTWQNEYTSGAWEKHIDDTEQPMIGIMTQTLVEEFAGYDFYDEIKGYKSYVMDSYVRFLEAQGAKVVPLIYGEPKEVTLEKLSKLNGIFLPGGGGDYLEIGELVFKTVQDYNRNGTFYPMWGTCLGFENLAIWSSDMREDVLNGIVMYKKSVPIDFLMPPHESKMYKDFTYGEINTLATKNVTQNTHSFAVPTEYYTTDKKLNDFWHLTSESTSDAGVKFGTSMESKEFPIMATLFHTEKPTQGYQIGTGINKSWESMEVNTKFIKLFVKMARANPHKYADYYESEKYMIQQHKIFRTFNMYGDIYLFE